MDADAPANHAETMSRVLARATATTRFAALLVGLLASLAALLAILGVYALVAQNAWQRRREYSLRAALGASPWTLGRTVLWHGARLAIIGGVAGALAAAMSGDLLRAHLFGVGARDPLSLIAIPTLLALAAMGATLVPARRVVRLEPADVLRDASDS